MKNEKTQSTIGLDIGTSRIVAAHRINEEEKVQAQLNAFVAIPYSRLTENSLKRENVPHALSATASSSSSATKARAWPTC